jgi:hypothetical protein
MSAVRARRIGEALGSGVTRGAVIRPCPTIISADDPLAAIVARLEEAGSCLLALPNTGYSPHLRVTRYEVVHSALDAYGWQGERVRQPHPSGAAIDRMGEALGWLAAISGGEIFAPPHSRGAGADASADRAASVSVAAARIRARGGPQIGPALASRRVEAGSRGAWRRGAKTCPKPRGGLSRRILIEDRVSIHEAAGESDPRRPGDRA